jgi:hypothetical protein
MASKKAKRVVRPTETLSLAWDAEKGPTDEHIGAALRILRADYWTSIRSTAREIVAAIDSGELTSEDELSDRVHEDTDGSYWVIYTHASYRAIQASDHDPFEDVADMGGDADSVAPALLAFYCVQNDLTEQVSAECDGDVNARIDAASKKAVQS